MVLCGMNVIDFNCLAVIWSLSHETPVVPLRQQNIQEEHTCCILEPIKRMHV